MINEVIPQDYIVEKFFQYAGYPKYKKITNVYEGGCPLCREGKSWGKKRRLYFVAKENYIFCHNCGWSGSPLNWVQEVTGKNYIEIINECKEFNTRGFQCFAYLMHNFTLNSKGSANEFGDLNCKTTNNLKIIDLIKLENNLKH